MMQPCTEEELMLYHNFTMMNEDETASTTTMPSKRMTKTTGRSFGRVMARVGMGLLLLLLVAEGAIVLPEEEKKGALWLDRGSFSPGRRTAARRVVVVDRAATAAAEKEEVVVTEDGFDGAGDQSSSLMTQRKIAKGSKKNPLLLFRQQIPVGMEAPQIMSVRELKATVVEVVRDIFSDNKRRALDKNHRALFL